MVKGERNSTNTTKYNKDKLEALLGQDFHDYDFKGIIELRLFIQKSEWRGMVLTMGKGENLKWLRTKSRLGRDNLKISKRAAVREDTDGRLSLERNTERA